MKNNNLKRHRYLIVVLALLTILLTSAPALAKSMRGDNVADRAGIESSAALSIAPAISTVGINSTFSVNVQIQINSTVFVGTDLFLNFDPAFLAVQSAVKGTDLPDVLTEPTFDNTAGTFNFSSGKLIGTIPSGTFTVVAITFLAKNITSTPTALTFSTASPRQTLINFGLYSATGPLTGGLYSIQDLTPPVVSSISPVDNSTGIAVNSHIALNFSKAMDRTITESAFNLSPAVAGIFSWSADNKSMSFTPNPALAFSANYSVNLSTAAKDVGGISLSAPFSSTFATQPGVNLALVPAAKTIGDNETFDVDIQAQCGLLHVTGVEILISYDRSQLEVIDSDNVTPGIQILPGLTLSTVIPNANNVDNSTGKISFSSGQLTEPFPSGTFSVATIHFKNKLVVDKTAVTFLVSANPIDNSTVVAFGEQNITGQLTGGLYSARPVVYSVSPGPAATGVALNTPLILTFSKAMNQTTVQNAFSILPAATPGFTWSTDGKILTVNFSNLLNSTLYTIGLSTAATAADGLSLAGSYSTTFTTLDASPSGGGGGGGGGGSSPYVYPSGFNVNTPLQISSNGYLQSAASLQTTDNVVTISIAGNTKMLTASNVALPGLTASPLASPPQPPAGNAIVLAYTFGPDGATFNPAITVTLKYDPSNLPAGVSESNLFVAYFDGTQWQMLEGVVDSNAHTITLKLTHFSSYAVIGKVSQPAVTTTTPAVTSTTTPTPTPAPPTTAISTTSPKPTVSAATTQTTTALISTPTTTTTPSVTSLSPTTITTTLVEDTKSSNIGLIIGIIIGVIAVLAIIVLIFRNRPKK